VGAIAAPMPARGVQLERDRSDADLVQLARQGDRSAFEGLVRRYSDRAFRVAFRVMRDASQAEDVTQEAFIKAYKGLSRFESRSSFYTWLYRIVVNLALDRRRSEQRAPSVEWDDRVVSEVEPRALRVDNSNPEQSSQRVQVRRIVTSGIQQLPDGQREVLLLREVDGLSYEEIARNMGISKGTVMSRLHYARKKMVAFLETHGVKPEDAT